MRRSASKTLVEETVTPGVSSPAGDPGYRYQVSYSQARSEIRLKRVRRTPDTRSERHRTLQNALDLQSRFLPDAKVSVISHEVDSRLESGYRITFKPGIGSGDDMFQTKMSAALITLAGEHETGKMWDTRWRADKGTIELYLKEPLPALVRHPVWKSLDEVGDGDRFHIPYATGEGGKQAFWNVSSKSTNPHSLIIGPTGGGKTSLIRTIMVECALRGIPMIGVDPKEIELDGMDDFPGVISVITQARRSAQLVRALADETAARNAYMRYHKLDPSDMPLLVIILDEFFILSGQWTQLAKSGDEETKNALNALDPLGAIGYLAALARSSGIRLCVGVQRPDANIFGKASGNVRDNFKTRVSLASLSQDGAMMMWGDASIGRELDASVPGRAMVTDLKGDAMLAQVWWTPNVDPHPKRRGALDTVDRNLVEALTPTVAPEVECYSASLAEFLENERALKSQPKPVPEPVRFGSSKTLAEIDDALPASVVAVGAEVLIPASDDPDSPLVTGTVQRTRRDGMNTVLAVQIHPEGTARPATVELEFTPGESVFLADVDTANATAAA